MLLIKDHSALVARLHNGATASGRCRRPVQFSSAAPAGLVKVVSGLKPPHLCAVKGAAKALDWTGRGTLCALCVAGTCYEPVISASLALVVVRRTLSVFGHGYHDERGGGGAQRGCRGGGWCLLAGPPGDRQCGRLTCDSECWLQWRWCCAGWLASKWPMPVEARARTNKLDTCHPQNTPRTPSPSPALPFLPSSLTID